MTAAVEDQAPRISRPFLFAFGGPVAWGACGRLEVLEDGRLNARNLALVYSARSAVGERNDWLPTIQRAAAAAGWSPSPGRCPTFAREELTLTCGQVDAGGAQRVHLTLCQGERDAELLAALSSYLHPPAGASDRLAWVADARRAETAAGLRLGRTLSISRLASLLRDRPLLAYTGAGVSVSSGIPTFEGQGALAVPKLIGAPLDEATLASLLLDPARLLAEVLRFQLSLLAAQPNPAHHALRHLEDAGLVHLVATDNLDRLHQKAGNRQVESGAGLVQALSRGEFPSAKLGRRWAALVVGLSRDEHGVIRALRARGVRIVIINLSPVPYRQTGDWFVTGRAEHVLPRLVDKLIAVKGD